MREFLAILIPYLFGFVASYLVFQPMKQFEDGYKCAKEHYSNWNRGFDEGFAAAKKHYQDWDEGFGEGFESGWNCALEQKGGGTGMTAKEAISILTEWVDNGTHEFIHEALQLAIKALSQDGGTISRRAALDEIDGFLAVDKYYHPYSQGKTIPVEEMRERLKQLSSVQPERKSCKGCVHIPQKYKVPCTFCARNTQLRDRWESEQNE